MLAAWERCGLDAERFWRSTPAEMSASFKARQQFLMDEHNGRVWLAWHIAALSRQQKLPKMSSLLAREKKREMTVDEQWSRMVAISKSRRMN